MDHHPIGNGKFTPRIPRELAALIAALQLKGANVEALLELTQDEWQSLLKFCDLAHLTLLLSQVETSAFPSWVADRLKQNRLDNAARFERVKATYQEAATALREANVDYILFKGFTQAPEYVGDSRLRMQSDLDFYCPQEMIGRAQAALQAIGYEPEGTLDYSRADHEPTMIRRGDWQWRGNMFDPDMPLSIELHFCLWNERSLLISLPEVSNFWERRIVRSMDGISFPALNPVDHLGYLSLHILRGLLSSDWIIHHVHELATFLHRHANDDEFWRAWKQSHSSAFRAVEAIAFYHAVSWFCCDIHEEVSKTFQQQNPELREWLSRFTGSSLEGMFQQNKDWVWLHAALLSSPTEKRRLIRRLLIPTKVAHADSPVIRVKNREIKQGGNWLGYGYYLSYIVSRIATHARMIPTTLYRGLGLWFSLRYSKRYF